MRITSEPHCARDIKNNSELPADSQLEMVLSTSQETVLILFIHVSAVSNEINLYIFIVKSRENRYYANSIGD